MKVLIDLESAADVDRLWHAYREHRAGQLVEPELFDAIARLIGNAEENGHLDRLTCDGIRDELYKIRPSLVLDCYWPALIKDRPALGAFLRREEAPDVAA
jgi:hypothetical protein